MSLLLFFWFSFVYYFILYALKSPIYEFCVFLFLFLGFSLCRRFGCYSSQDQRHHGATHHHWTRQSSPDSPDSPRQHAGRRDLLPRNSQDMNWPCLQRDLASPTRAATNGSSAVFQAFSRMLPRPNAPSCPAHCSIQLATVHGPLP